MTQQAQDLLQKALSLSDRERADLAASLIDSLETHVDEAAESAWDEAVADRIKQLDSGEAKTIPWDQVRARISSKPPHAK
jgi:putative addiction module component (TIGR02574 family)